MIWLVLIYLISLLGSVICSFWYVRKHLQKLNLSNFIEGVVTCILPVFNTILCFVCICVYLDKQPEIIIWKRKETP